MARDLREQSSLNINLLVSCAREIDILEDCKLWCDEVMLEAPQSCTRFYSEVYNELEKLEEIQFEPNVVPILLEAYRWMSQNDQFADCAFSYTFDHECLKALVYAGLLGKLPSEYAAIVAREVLTLVHFPEPLKKTIALSWLSMPHFALNGADLLKRDIDFFKARQLEEEENKAKASKPASEIEVAKPDEHKDGFLVVVPQLTETDSTTKVLATQWKAVIGIPLPLAKRDDRILATARRTLENEFPHARAITFAVFSELERSPYVRVRPTLLVGEPGCGKTSYATRLLELIELPHDLVPAAGVNDATFVGASKRWSTGGPSAPLSFIKLVEQASVGFVFDELEKVATGHHNGSLQDSLLPLLEPSSAKRWRDPCFEVECDLSAITWLATANGLDGIEAMHGADSLVMSVNGRARADR